MAAAIFIITHESASDADDVFKVSLTFDDFDLDDIIERGQPLLASGADVHFRMVWVLAGSLLTRWSCAGV